MGENQQRVVVDFCAGNLMSFTHELFLKLREEHPDWQISKYGCLTNCGECAVRPFAIVNDELLAAEDLEAFTKRLYEQVAKA